MKPNDEAIDAARAEGKMWAKEFSRKVNQIPYWKVLRQADDKRYGYDVIAKFNNPEERDKALERLRAEAMLTAAYAAQFQSEDYAGLVKQLRFIDEDTLNIEPYSCEQLCKSAADALEAVLADRDALKAGNNELREENENLKAANRYSKDWVDNASQDIASLRDERDALAARLDLGSEEQSMTKLRIGPFLKKVRQEKQMTLRAVEEATDKEISNAYLSQLESGKIANPSPHVLYTLSLVFGVAYETLMERAGYVMPAPNRLASVEDKALVEIAMQAAYKAEYGEDMSIERAETNFVESIYKPIITAAIAAVRPHIEAAERERCAKIAETPELWVTDKPTRGCDDIAAAIRSAK